MKENILKTSLKQNKKQSPTDKRFNAISLICAALCIILLAVFGVYLLIDVSGALTYFAVAFYALVPLLITGTILGAGLVLRNPYFDSILSLLLLGLSFILILTAIIAQAAIYSEIFIYPNIPV